MKNLEKILIDVGFSQKAAPLYLAALELGETTVKDLAKRAGIKRTTIYYLLEALKSWGALIETKRKKKTYYIAEKPATLLRLAKERVRDFEESINFFEEKYHSAYRRPRVYFLYGPQGFKQIWNKIFESSEKEYRIITQGEGLLDFVKEKYLLDEIIKRKKALAISSKQLISDSPYARKIISKDSQENRQSKLLPSIYKLPFTEIICKEFAAFISQRYEDMLMIIESESYARTRRSIFDILWNSLQG